MTAADRYAAGPAMEARLAELEPPYRSRGEAQVGRFLRRYRLPFLYEPPVPVYHNGRWRTWHPDFLLPEHGDLLIEYAGMISDPAYRRSAMAKRRAYGANGYRALFLYPADIRGPDWPRRLLDRVQRAYGARRAYGRRSTY